MNVEEKRGRLKIDGWIRQSNLRAAERSGYGRSRQVEV